MNIPADYVIPLGPRGGNLDVPRQKPQARQGQLNDVETGLHKFKDTAVHGYENEKPWHNLAAALLVQGKSNQQVAVLAGVTEGCIAQLKLNRWFQERMAQQALEISGSVLDRMKAEADASLDQLIRIRDLSDNERVVVDVSKYIIDQAHGKAVQKILSISASTSYSSEQEEFDAIQSQLDALRKAKQQEPAVVIEAQQETQT